MALSFSVREVSVRFTSSVTFLCVDLIAGSIAQEKSRAADAQWLLYTSQIVSCPFVLTFLRRLIDNLQEPTSFNIHEEYSVLF